MANDSPQAIKFINEQVRVLSEEARAFNARVAAMSTEWFGGINALVSNDSSPIVDGRDAEGISRLSGADVNSAVGILIAMAAASNSEIIQKPCVNPLRVN